MATPPEGEAQPAVPSHLSVCWAWPGPSAVAWKLRESGRHHGNKSCSEVKPPESPPLSPRHPPHWTAGASAHQLRLPGPRCPLLHHRGPQLTGLGGELWGLWRGPGPLPAWSHPWSCKPPQGPKLGSPEGTQEGAAVTTHQPFLLEGRDSSGGSSRHVPRWAASQPGSVTLPPAGRQQGGEWMSPQSLCSSLNPSHSPGPTAPQMAPQMSPHSPRALSSETNQAQSGTNQDIPSKNGAQGQGTPGLPTAGREARALVF